MSKFRKKPIVVEAVQWFGEPCSIETLEGTLFVSPGDWIIAGVKGERYPCKPDIFAATYEPAAGAPAPLDVRPADAPCTFCNEPTDPFSADPGRWPVMLPRPDGGGKARHQHVACVVRRLYAGAPAEHDAEKETAMHNEIGRAHV